MNTTLIIINYSISGLISIWALYRIYLLSIGEEIMRKAIANFFSKENLTFDGVSKLSINERIKYGVPLPVLGFYNYIFGIITGKIDYTRRVDLSNKDDKDIIKYITISVKKRNVFSIKEFDSYFL